MELSPTELGAGPPTEQYLKKLYGVLHENSEEWAKNGYAAGDPLRTIRYIEAVVAVSGDDELLENILAIAHWQMSCHEKRMLTVRVALGFTIVASMILLAVAAGLLTEKPTAALGFAILFGGVSAFSREFKDFILEDEKRFRDAWSSVISNLQRRRHAAVKAG
jgi:hypothetical protein